MIIDAHTHVFPPQMIAQRDELLTTEPAFREVYSDPRAALATADDVLQMIERSEVDAAVICNFAWSDAERVRDTNDYVLDAATASGGRLIPFCMLQPAAGDAAVRAELERMTRAGAGGIGELRPEQQGYSLGDETTATLLAEASSAYGLPLLFHVSEPVGHCYPGKSGLALADFARFLREHPEATVIGAHWGGGLPLYATMPEVRADLQGVYVDTAASRLLYSDAIYRTVAALVGAETILFGSDFPLRDPAAEIAHIRSLGLGPGEESAILGGNAARLLGR
ncbi:MAG: amidohydrolase family protein [Dehalococcoidia bacterium]